VIVHAEFGCVCVLRNYLRTYLCVPYMYEMGWFVVRLNRIVTTTR
jgi:hypothetical protein